MAKRKRKSTIYPYQWMRDKDLRSTVLLFWIMMLLLSILVLYILAIVDPKGYQLLFSLVAYVFGLYKKAGPGSQLAFIQVPLFTLVGFLLRGWFSKKK